jgi:hypothetical protein
VTPVATTTTKSATKSTTKSSTSTTSQQNSSKCSNGDGFYSTPGCTGYYRCVYSGTSNELVTAVNLCPTGQLFDVSLNVCNWASNVNCAA